MYNHKNKVYRINFDADSKGIRFISEFSVRGDELYDAILKDLEKHEMLEYFTPANMVKYIRTTGTVRVWDKIYVKPGKYNVPYSRATFNQYVKHIEDYMRKKLLSDYVEKL